MGDYRAALEPGLSNSYGQSLPRHRLAHRLMWIRYADWLNRRGDVLVGHRRLEQRFPHERGAVAECS